MRVHPADFSGTCECGSVLGVALEDSKPVALVNAQADSLGIPRPFAIAVQSGHVVGFDGDGERISELSVKLREADARGQPPRYWPGIGSLAFMSVPGSFDDKVTVSPLRPCPCCDESPAAISVTVEPVTELVHRLEDCELPDLVALRDRLNAIIYDKERVK